MKGRRYTDYLLELDFQNIKTVWISKSKIPGRRQETSRPNERSFNHFEEAKECEPSEVYLRLVIQMRRPVPASKFGPSHDFSEETTSLPGSGR